MDSSQIGKGDISDNSAYDALDMLDENINQFDDSKDKEDLPLLPRKEDISISDKKTRNQNGSGTDTSTPGNDKSANDLANCGNNGLQTENESSAITGINPLQDISQNNSINNDGSNAVKYNLDGQDKNETRNQIQSQESGAAGTFVLSGSCRFKNKKLVEKFNRFQSGVPLQDTDDEAGQSDTGDEAVQPDADHAAIDLSIITIPKNHQTEFSFFGLSKQQFIICVVINLLLTVICSTATGVIVYHTTKKGDQRYSTEENSSFIQPSRHYTSFKLLIWNETAFVTIPNGKYGLTKKVYDKSMVSLCANNSNSITCGKQHSPDCEIIPKDDIVTSDQTISYTVDMTCVNRTSEIIWTLKDNDKY